MADGGGGARGPRRRVALALKIAAVGALVALGVAVWAVRSLRSTERTAGATDVPALAEPATWSEGAVSIHGDDYAYDVVRERIVVCDVERDGRPVKVEYETDEGEIETLFDVSDRRETCTSLDVEAGVARHRVCEANITWTCHNWQSTR